MNGKPIQLNRRIRALRGRIWSVLRIIPLAAVSLEQIESM